MNLEELNVKYMHYITQITDAKEIWYKNVMFGFWTMVKLFLELSVGFKLSLDVIRSICIS